MSFGEVNEQGQKLIKERRDAEARGHYERALGDREFLKGLEPDEVGQLWNNYGLACRRLVQNEEAKMAYTKALELFRKSPEPPAHEITVTLSNLGVLALAQKDNDAAFDYLCEELDLHKKSPNDMRRLGWCLHNLAEVFCRKGEFAAAERNLKHALELRNAALPSDDADIAENYKMLGDVFFTVDKRAEAKEAYSRALPKFEQVLGSSNGVVIDIKNQLKILENA